MEKSTVGVIAVIAIVLLVVFVGVAYHDGAVGGTTRTGDADEKTENSDIRVKGTVKNVDTNSDFFSIDDGSGEALVKQTSGTLPEKGALVVVTGKVAKFSITIFGWNAGSFKGIQASDVQSPWMFK